MEDVFGELKKILAPVAGKLDVTADEPGNFYVEESLSGSKPQMFGAVQAKKNYVSFHLFPVYTEPDLLSGISPELSKRMQGKSCFNFKSPDQIPSVELSALVKACYNQVAG